MIHKFEIEEDNELLTILEDEDVDLEIEEYDEVKGLATIQNYDWSDKETDGLGGNE